ncbi:MAG: hypothetical protein C5B59_19435 [Bacteroidetes bacterium]|nr:MAG: hypothetical protein C5B59_19435 [Bacteroidota bacterium]
MHDSFWTNHQSLGPFKRREFIQTALQLTSAATLISKPGFSSAKEKFSNKSYTVQDIIDLILKEIPGTPYPKSVDTVKSGSANQNVTGIVTTMFATTHVIQEAARSQANFIIAHEPTFYNHTDDINWVQNNSVVKRKQDLLSEHDMAVWRFHDYWHSFHPDGIMYGFVKAANWLPYFKAGSHTLQLPPTSLSELIDHLRTSLSINHLRFIGDPAQRCEKIVLVPGAAGGQVHIALAEKEKPDVLIVGEVQEWETAEYIRDARLQGTPISLIVLGHSVSEEPGMQWLAEWLQPKLPELKIQHIASGDPFSWI